MNARFHFLVNKETTYLNFGSFGSCPRDIFDEYQNLQLQLEYQPVEFIVDRANHLLNEARKKLSDYVDCDHEDLVLVTNPSYAANTIAKSFPLKKGEEVLSTNLEYGAIVETWKRACKEKGAEFIEQNIEFPIKDEAHFIDQFWQGFSTRTRAIFISHITSSTALILPVEKICIEAKRRGLITIVDGAHVPGQMPLSLRKSHCDVYIGACHKWMMAPKGASFFYASEEAQKWIKPLVVSWGSVEGHQQNTQFIDDHQTNGTRDLSALLTIPYCLQFMAKNHWDSVTKECKTLCLNFAKELTDQFNLQNISPINPLWIGQMFAIPIQITAQVDLRMEFKNNYNIELPITQLNKRHFIRYSVQAFNDRTDLLQLQNALVDLRQKKVLSF